MARGLARAKSRFYPFPVRDSLLPREYASWWLLPGTHAVIPHVQTIQGKDLVYAEYV
jgi:hypothetical protein